MSLPEKRLAPQEYMDRRAEEQRLWYEGRATRFERLRLVLGGLVATVGFVTSALNTIDLNLGADTAWHPWLVVAGAVLMAVSSALTATASLRSADFLSSSYRSAAFQIRQLQLDLAKGERYPGPEGFRQFVLDVEDVMTREHAGWSKAVLLAAAPPVAGDAPADPTPDDDDEPVGGGNDHEPALQPVI